jgi:hypothetical protein
MSRDEIAPAPPSEFRLSVLLEKEQVQHGRWSVPRWRLLGVVAGDKVGHSSPGPTLIHSSDGREQYQWTGFTLHLYRDSAESYWYNLVGEKPSLFVVLQGDDAGEMKPVLVTANYDEAGAHLEADDTVLSAPMPAEIYRWIERYVMDNYTPQEKKKRRREIWSEGMEHGKRPKTH